VILSYKMPALMRYKKKSSAPFRRRGRYAGVRRRARISRQPKIYTYKQIYYKSSAFQMTSGSPLLSTFQFTLNGAGGNVPAFTQIYDQYKISKVVIKFIPKFNMMASDVGSSVNFVSVIDYDDSNPLPNTGAAWQYQSCKMTRGTAIHTRILKPSANALFDASSGALAPRKSPWLDCNNTSVPHYGIKLACNDLPAGANALDFDLQVIYYIAFKNVM